MNEDLRFVEAITKLETIIDKLEQGVEDLDEIVSLFEQGSELIAFCGDKLTEVETKIEVISKKIAKNESKVSGFDAQGEILTDRGSK